MSTEKHTSYHGDGRVTESIHLPYIDPNEQTNPEGYRAGRGLVAAVNAALRLGMPLLLTGEPGTGKTQLAYNLAHELNLGDPLRFVVKSDTRGRDLLYDFDTVGRFHAANAAKATSNSLEIDPRRYLRFNALGKAILYSYTKDQLTPLLAPAMEYLELPDAPRKSVVLIDEIDKAPRDVPNDLLAELDELQFGVPEMANHSGQKGGSALFSIQEDNAADLRPLIIITSNSERSLPDPFLRRCLYYHLPFPEFGEEKADDETTVQTIVSSRMGYRYKDNRPLVDSGIDFFRHLRNQQLERKPGLAELLNWLNYLAPVVAAFSDEPLHRQAENPEGKQALLDGIKVALLKNSEDQNEADKLLNSWLKVMAQS